MPDIIVQTSQIKAKPCGRTDYIFPVAFTTDITEIKDALIVEGNFDTAKLKFSSIFDDCSFKRVCFFNGFI